MESHATFFMVQGYVNLLAVCLDKKSYEATSEGESSVSGRDRAGQFQEILLTHCKGITTG